MTSPIAVRRFSRAEVVGRRRRESGSRRRSTLIVRERLGPLNALNAAVRKFLTSVHDGMWGRVERILEDTAETYLLERDADGRTYPTKIPMHSLLTTGTGDQ